MRKIIKNLEVIDYTHMGLGIAKDAGEVIFVKNAIVGEIVDIEIKDYKKKIAYGEVHKFSFVSPNRCEPKCEKYNECGGCSIMHMNYDEQIRFKKSIVKNMLRKQNVTIDDFDIIHNPDEFNYRNKVVFKFIISNNKINLGFNGHKNINDVIIDKCLLISENMNIIKKKVEEIITNKYLYLGQYLNKLTIRENDKNEIMLVLEIKRNDLRINNLLDEIMISCNILYGGVILNNKLIYENQKSDFSYKLKEKLFVISLQSFFQVNTKQMINMYDDIKALISPSSKNVLDAYCGVGSIGLYATPKDKTLVGVELIKSAQKMAQKNAILNNIANASFFCVDLEKDDSIKRYDMDAIDTVIVDPPRKGLSKKFLSMLINKKPREIIYVSCSFNTLIRDLKFLEDSYKIVFFRAYDMFSQTFHVELIVKLELK